MGIVNPKVRLADSVHKIVWAHDPDVIEPKYAGWIPVSACGGLRDGADVLEVRGLHAGEVAEYGDRRAAGGGASSALLWLAGLAVLSVSGARGAAVGRWLEGAYQTHPRIVGMLAEYVLVYSRGDDPVPVFHAEAREVFGDLPSFHRATTDADVVAGVGA